MSEQKEKGIFQLENGFWGYRLIFSINGKKKAQKRVKDENGNPFRTKRQAAKARSIALAQEQAKAKESSNLLSQKRKFNFFFCHSNTPIFQIFVLFPFLFSLYILSKIFYKIK